MDPGNLWKRNASQRVWILYR